MNSFSSKICFIYFSVVTLQVVNTRQTISVRHSITLENYVIISSATIYTPFISNLVLLVEPWITYDFYKAAASYTKIASKYQKYTANYKQITINTVFKFHRHLCSIDAFASYFVMSSTENSPIASDFTIHI